MVKKIFSYRGERILSSFVLKKSDFVEREENKMFGFSSKEEFEWWKEDNKGKFYGLCAVGGVSVLALFMILLSAFSKTPAEEVPTEEDVVTEIEIGNFDVVGAIEEQEKNQNEERNKRYGRQFELMPYTMTYENWGGGAFVSAKTEEGESFTLYFPEEKNLQREVWNWLFVDKGIYALRGAFSEIDPGVVKAWEEKDYDAVVSLFKDSNFNKATAKAWNTHMQELKVSFGYKKSTPDADIADDDLDLILDQMKSWFPEYLRSVDENGKALQEEEAVVSAIDSYLAHHPVPVYENIKVADPVYVCEADGTPYGELSDDAFLQYRSLYWNTYFKEAEEEFLNESDRVSILGRGYKDGVFYALKKPVNFSLLNDVSTEEMVVWLKYADGTTEYYYYPGNMWSTTDRGYLNDYYTIPVVSGVSYFGYFLLDKEYKVDASSEFETLLHEKNPWDDGLFEVKKDICYRRSDIYKDDSVLYLSEFLFESAPLALPPWISYLANDTEYTVNIEEENQGLLLVNFSSGDEIFVDRNYINNISWKVQ